MVQIKYSKEKYEDVMKDKLARCGFLSYKNSDLLTKNKAVFLDRDGTIIVDKVETRKIEDLEFFNDIQSLKKLQNADFKLIIITNQSGIGKGHYTEKDMTIFNDYMIKKLEEQGIFIDALYFCPHIDEDNCKCKKPKDGMLKRASIDLNIDLSQSYLIGDQNSDIMAGLNAGLKKCIAVTTGLYPNNESKQYEIDTSISDDTTVCDNLENAVLEVLKK